MENNELTLESKIEALLFFKGEPISSDEISVFLNEDKELIENSISELRAKKEKSGIVILEQSGKYTLGTHPELGPLFEEVRKEELSKDLSKASLETLSIILYKNGAGEHGVTRAEIDYIRGVNSSFILRNLLIRGLIQKNVDKNDSRRYIYEPTIDSLQFLGITRIEELPDYENVLGKLNNVLNNNKEEENQDE